MTMLLTACTEEKKTPPAPVIHLTNKSYELEIGNSVVLSPTYENVDASTIYIWTVNGKSVGKDPSYTFSSESAGSFTIEIAVTNEGGATMDAIGVMVSDGTPVVPEDSAAAVDEVFEFMPAPGQFVNSGYECKTMEDACAYAKGQLDKEALISLGAFGGCIVAGFSHHVKNDGGYNIAITGNPFEGSSEPGIVWVMKDENGNGLPDDIWYELKGSEYGKDETLQNYSITYYHPDKAGQSVKWKDSQGNSGEVPYLASYHKQDYYYPLWAPSDSLRLSGTRLKSRSYDESGTGTYWVNPSFDWGYADNFSPTDRLTASPSDPGSVNHFRISDAVNADGTAANLDQIDFVKVETGIVQNCGWIGEASTEVLAIKDYNMLKNKQ
jgi:hypothetical protein